MEIVFTPPLVLDENGDIQVYPDLDSVLQDVEPIDVRNGEYELFDSEGRKLVLAVVREQAKCLWWHVVKDKVTVVSSEPRPTHAEDLRRRLLKFLEKIGEAIPEVSRASLLQIIDHVARIQRCSPVRQSNQTAWSRGRPK